MELTIGGPRVQQFLRNISRCGKPLVKIIQIFTCGQMIILKIDVILIHLTITHLILTKTFQRFYIRVHKLQFLEFVNVSDHFLVQFLLEKLYESVPTLLDQLFDVSRLFFPLFSHIGELDESRRLTSIFSKIFQAFTNKPRRLRHRSREEIERLPVSHDSRLWAARSQQIAVRRGVVFGQKLFRLELFTASLNRTFVDLGLELSSIGSRVFKPTVFLPVDPAFRAEPCLLVTLGSLINTFRWRLIMEQIDDDLHRTVQVPLLTLS